MSTWQLMFVLLIYIPIVLLWLFALTDLTKRRNLSGLAKSLWAVAIVFLPVVGMFVYFATGPGPEPDGDQNDG